MIEADRNKLGIFPKLLIVMVFVSTIPLALIWYATSQSTEHLVNEQVNQRLSQTSSTLSSYIDGWVEMNVRMLKQNSDIPAVTSMQKDQQTPILKIINQQYEWIYLAFTVAINGDNISRSDDKPLTKYGDRSYVRQVLGGKPLGQQVLVGKTSGKPALVLATPIKNGGDKPTGILAIAMTLKELSSKVVDAKIGSTGYAFLLDPDGRVIAHPSNEYTSERKDMSSHPAYRGLMFDNNNHIDYIDEQNNRVISYSSKTPHGWILVVQQHYAEAYASLEKTNQNAQVLLIGTVLLAFTIALIVSGRLIKPIKRLTHVADQVSRGDFSSESADNQRKDELGDLARAIERLGQSVRLSMEHYQRQ
ncbi:HAMP domain-containing protein [Sedimenticola selenatireducens]|uniref:histidine kinase n=1 Tax=Sedimenticola selenatireducens TaxID=191960 RepID=A0A558DPZ6_9GAMM|nr:cache and HAMP domain-containing protein [Sedimenticola selenatireducens]TVO70500.1 HAMP domain-containing protein [Sedimenticola selenatireducens]TVT63077.1 MAG: HAMP domain-containing protein [Sedimenticola selenatireducens]